MPASFRTPSALRSAFCVLLIPAVIAGCGGGGPETPNGGGSEPEKVLISGVAIDGYISGAEIRCLSINGSLIARAESGENGQWSFELDPGVRCHTIESVGGTDVGLGDGSTDPVRLSASTVYRARVDHIDPTQLTSSTLVVSPVTSLIAELQGSDETPDRVQPGALRALGIRSDVDPLKVDPVKTGDVELFRAGNLVAAMIREISNGIADALSANGAAQEVSVGSLFISKRVVMGELATLIASGNVVLGQSGSSEAIQTVAGATLEALTTSANASNELKSAAAALPPTAVSLAIGAIAIDATAKIQAGQRLQDIAATSAAESRPDPRKTELIDALIQNKASIDSIPEGRRSELIGSLREALAGPADGNINLRLPCDIGDDCGIVIPVALRSYLEIADSRIQILTTGDDFTVTLDDFSNGRVSHATRASEGLSGVAVRILQSNIRPQLNEVSRQVDLGFKLVKTTGTPYIALSALVKNIGLRWVNDQIEVTTDGASVITAAKFAENADWGLLDLGEINPLSLVSAAEGALLIDLEQLVESQRLKQILDSFLGKGTNTSTFELSAVIQGHSTPLIFAARENESDSPVAVQPIELMVRDKVINGTTSKTVPFTLIGPGFKGQVTLQ